MQVLGAYCGNIGEWALDPGTNTTLGGYIFSAHSEGAALTRDEDHIPGMLWLQPKTTALTHLQTFVWDARAQQLRSPLANSCIGADPPSPRTNVWGRMLSDGSVALVFVNAEEIRQTVDCPWSTCLHEMGVMLGDQLHVRDLVRHVTLPDVRASDGVAVDVEGGGGSVMLRVFVSK